MTTLLMTADAVGGVWQYAVELARGLRPHGVEATLLVFGPPPSDVQRAEAADVPVLLAGEAAPWMVDDAAPASRALAMAVERLRPDIVQVNEPALLAAGRLPVPTVAVCHSCLATWWAAVRGGAMPAAFERRTAAVRLGLAHADRVVAPSAAFARAVAESYAIAPPAVVRNGRSSAGERAERSAPPSSSRKPRSGCPGPRGHSRRRRSMALDPGSPLRSGRDDDQGLDIVSAGRLWDDGKGMATLDAAAALMSRPVHVAGPLRGPDGAVFTPRYLDAIGTLSDAAMARLLADATIFVSPALYEPFGLSVLEAAQAGCALVLSDIPTFRELWDGAAVFVPPGAPERLADAIDHLAARPLMVDVLAARARDRAAAYGVAAMIDGYRALYAGLHDDRELERAA